MKWSSPLLGLLLSIAVGGCLLRPDREINLDIFYPTPQRSEVIVKYRVPPPPSGSVYVLWILNPDLGKQIKIGEIPPSDRLSAVRVAVDFLATGAIVSIESSVDATEIGSTWALKAGQTSPSPSLTPRPK